MLALAIKVNTELISWVLGTYPGMDRPDSGADSLDDHAEASEIDNGGLVNPSFDQSERREEQRRDLLALVEAVGVALQELAAQNGLVYRSLSAGQRKSRSSSR